MSTKYNHGYEVPTDILCNRLRELSNSITNGKNRFENEFTMRVPAEMDRDADLILYEAARRIQELSKQISGEI